MQLEKSRGIPQEPCVLCYLVSFLLNAQRTEEGARVLVAQACPRLCEPVDCSLPGSSVHGISQTRILESKSCSVVSDSLRPHGLYSPWNSLGQNTGVGSLSLLQGIFPTQGSNPGLPHCRRIVYQLTHKGSPRILEWIAYPFSSRLLNPGIELGSPALQADS